MNRWLTRVDNIIKQLCQWPALRTLKFLEKFIRFCLVGSLNTVIDFSLFFSLTRLTDIFKTHYLWANFLAFTVANIFSFMVNKNWTFNNRSPYYFRQYYKFLTVSIMALLAVQLILYWLITGLGVWDVIAKLVALLVSVAIGFLGSRFWAFR